MVERPVSVAMAGGAAEMDYLTTLGASARTLFLPPTRLRPGTTSTFAPTAPFRRALMPGAAAHLPASLRDER